jgi:hypothetical protein
MTGSREKQKERPLGGAALDKYKPDGCPQNLTRIRLETFTAFKVPGFKVFGFNSLVPLPSDIQRDQAKG